MSDVTRRLSRWKAKYSPEIAAQTTARIYADMSERYQASMIALCTMETETKQVLSASGIDTMYIVFYLDYARQLFRLSHGRTISGPTLAKEAQVLLEKWQNRGLRPDVLAAIRTDVFSVPAPTP
jgi:acyl-CoA reductase-like NAD-dependent aldehyde dehydrogenase